MSVPTAAVSPMSPAQFDPSQLADIHLPQAIGLWPVAPGWWILLALFVLLIILIFLFSKDRSSAQKQITKKQQKALALIELSEIEKHYKTAVRPHQSIKQLSVFLRRFALSQFHREQVASLTDTQWLSLLDKMFDTASSRQPFTNEFAELLTMVPYQPDSNELDIELINKLFTDTQILVKNYKSHQMANYHQPEKKQELENV